MTVVILLSNPQITRPLESARVGFRAPKTFYSNRMMMMMFGGVSWYFNICLFAGWMKCMEQFFQASFCTHRFFVLLQLLMVREIASSWENRRLGNRSLVTHQHSENLILADMLCFIFTAAVPAKNKNTGMLYLYPHFNTSTARNTATLLNKQ